MKQFHVVFEDGSQDWVDPVETFTETEYKYIVGNGWYDYSFDKAYIKSWEFLEVEE